jgi:hypothetical protein
MPRFSPDNAPGGSSSVRACRNPDCQVARRLKKQKRWRGRHPDYFIARRILDRGKADRPPEPLRLPPPLSRLPWDLAQDEFGVKATDFIGVLGTVLLRDAQSQFEAYRTDLSRLSPPLPASSAQSQIQTVAPFGAGMKAHEAGVSPTGPRS